MIEGFMPWSDELKIKLMTETERKIFEELGSIEKADVLSRLDMEAFVDAELGQKMSITSLRMLIRSIEVSIPHMPEETHAFLTTARDGYYALLAGAMKSYFEGGARCPGCGEIHERDKNEVN